jgi:hypothetical protein
MNARNPNRTTKPERRFIRRYNPYAARILGVAQAARWYREGILLDEARGFDNILDDLKYGIVPFDLNDRVNAAIDGQRRALERKLGIAPDMLAATSSDVNHYSAHEPRFTLNTDGTTHTGYEVGTGPNAHITLKYPPHISLGPVGAAAAESLAAAWEAEPLGPSECGHYEVVETAMSMDAIALTPETIARLGLGDYADWDGNPWHDPNEVAAMHAEVIERELNDDIDPGD